MIEKEIGRIYDLINKDILIQLTGYVFEEDMKLIGKLKTEMSICNKYEGIEIAIDKNEYLDVTDYELEIEYRNEYPKYIMNLLERINVSTSNINARSANVYFWQSAKHIRN